jgi:hypothetical protein
MAARLINPKDDYENSLALSRLKAASDLLPAAHLVHH